MPDPFGCGIVAGDALPRAGILDIMFVVPDAHPRVQLIVDDTCAASHISTNTGVAPRGTFRAGDAIGVEIAGHRARALTRSELAEDALDDERFSWNDLAPPAHKYAFAVRPPSAPLADARRSGGEAIRRARSRERGCKTE